ncbi:hypothetical protein Droror1_Dr00001814 [Drosera rotundifolia]
MYKYGDSHLKNHFHLCIYQLLEMATSLLSAMLPAMAVNITFDHRSLMFDGERKLLISTSIHYPRSVPEMWPKLVKLPKEGGADYNFEYRFDLVKFVKIVQDAGMYMMLRIGPFVAAEWNYGYGVPVWLHYEPRCVFRTATKPYMYHMKKFMTKIVNMMKKGRLFASQGGPIILSQVENEYGGWYEEIYGEKGKEYAMWAAHMALSQNTGVPWVMCVEQDAPYTVIDTYNSFYCDQFAPNNPLKPKIWTENWPGWYMSFGSPIPHRPPEDIAFSVALFLRRVVVCRIITCTMAGQVLVALWRFMDHNKL